MPVIGWLKYDPRGRGKAERELLYGLPVWCARTSPSGWLEEYRLKKAGRALRNQGALRVLAPAGFGGWSQLEACGLSPVDPAPFLRAQSATLALEALERGGIAPDRASVALRGLRADREMARAAAELCPRVRHLIISAPRGGDELANWLRREFGVPVLPRGERGQVALLFHPEGAGEEGQSLELYGPSPELAGLTVTAPALGEEDRTDLALLAALWEGGKLGKDAVKIT